MEVDSTDAGVLTSSPSVTDKNTNLQIKTLSSDVECQDKFTAKLR